MTIPDRAPCAVFHHPSDLGAGAGTRALGLIAALRRQGWLIASAREDGVAEHERLANNGLHGHEAILTEAARLVALWQDLRPAVVHVEVPGPEALAWKIAAKRLHLPLTTTHHRLHNWLPSNTLPARRREILAFNQDFMQACQQLLIELPHERGELATLGLHAVSVVGNGVDSAHFHPRRRCATLRTTWKATPNTLVLLYVGRVLPAKGLALLADAFTAAHQHCPHCVMVVVVDGDGLVDLQQRCPWVVYTGMLRDVELATAYASADIFLFPSQIDNYGLVVGEAMASGLACVAFNRAAAGAFLTDGTSARLVSTEADFIAATLALVAHPELVYSCGQAARQKADALSWNEVGKAAAAAFNQAIAHHASRQEPSGEPLVLVVRAPLPQPLPAGATALLRRGHHLAWIDPAHEPLERPGTLLDAADLSGPWSPQLALHEARWSALQHGVIPAENPLKISLVLSAERAVEVRLKRLAQSLRNLGHPAELTLTAEAERTWQATPPDAVYLTAHAHALAPRARQLGLRVSTIPLPEGVDTELYHPRQRQADIRHAWHATDDLPVVLLLVTNPDHPTTSTLRALTAVKDCVLVAACLTAAAAHSLRAAGFTTTMVEGVSGTHLPKVLASADLVVLADPQPTRSAILSTLACGAALVLTTRVAELPPDIYLAAMNIAPDIQGLLNDIQQRNRYTTAGKAYAATHTWVAAAHRIVQDLQK